MRRKQLNKQRRSGGLFVFLVVSSTMCLGIGTALLFANDGRRLRHLLDILLVTSQAHQNPHAASDGPASKTTLPAQTTVRLQPTKRAVKTLPAFDRADCQSLASLPQTSLPEYQSYENGGWECSHLLEFPETGFSSSVFIQVRGDVASVWTNFRIKLNFGSHLSRQNLASVTVGFVDRLVGLGVANKDALEDALARQTAFTTSVDGVAMRYWQEPIDERRFHLMGSGNNSAGPHSVSSRGSVVSQPKETRALPEGSNLPSARR